MDTQSSLLELLASALPSLIIMIGLPVLVLCVLFWLLVKAQKAITAIKHRKRDKEDRDSRRAFSSREKSLASKMCNHRCEGTGVLFRCRYRGNDLHGDHWYPHSKGGATSPENLVMLCPSCNRSKSDHIPSRLQTNALNRRRKKHRDYSGNPVVPVGLWLPKGDFASYGIGTRKQQMSLRPKF